MRIEGRGEGTQGKEGKGRKWVEEGMGEEKTGE